MLNEGRSLSVRFLIGNPGMMLIHAPLVHPCIILWPIILCPFSMPDQALSASTAAVCSHLWCPVIHHSVFPVPYVENWACYISSLLYADPQWICSWGFSACLEGICICTHLPCWKCSCEYQQQESGDMKTELAGKGWRWGVNGKPCNMKRHVI